jgi:hypothetical protein
MAQLWFDRRHLLEAFNGFFVMKAVTPDQPAIEPELRLG